MLHQADSLAIWDRYPSDNPHRRVARAGGGFCGTVFNRVAGLSVFLCAAGSDTDAAQERQRCHEEPVSIIG